MQKRHRVTKACKAGAVISVLVLSGCFGLDPVTYTGAKLAVDGLSYLSTGKGTTDHGLSAVSGKDCNMLNLLRKSRLLCERWKDENGGVVAVRTNADQPAAVGRSVTPGGAGTGNDGTPYFSLWAPQH